VTSSLGILLLIISKISSTTRLCQGAAKDPVDSPEGFSGRYISRYYRLFFGGKGIRNEVRRLLRLTPFVSAKKALRFMNTYQLAALGTGPLFQFVFNEMSYTEFLYVREILNHTHSILGPVTLIQVIQPVAGEIVTAEAVPGVVLPKLFTVFNSTCDAGFWFDAVVAPATGACIFVPCICSTKTAVHSAGSNQRHLNFFFGQIISIHQQDR
jgi:hypothetical protein